MKRLAVKSAIVFGTLSGAILLWQLRDAIVVFLFSLALVAAVRPLVLFLNGGGLSKAVAVLATYLILFSALLVLVMVTIVPLTAEFQRLGGDTVEVYEQIVQTWPEGTVLKRVIARQLPQPKALFSAVSGEAGRTHLQAVLGVTSNLVGLAVKLAMVVVLSIYWAIDREYFERLWLTLLPARLRMEATNIWRSVELEVGSYLRSEVVQSVMAGVLLWLGYEVLGHRYPVLLAIVGALAWFLPWVGAILALAAVVLLSLPALMSGEHGGWILTLLPAAAYTVLVLLVLQLLVEPKLFNNRRFNSLLIAIVTIALVELIGLPGLILGPPLAATLQLVGGHALRLRIAAAPPVQTRVTIADRLAELRHSFETLEEQPPELKNMLDRLTSLVQDASPVLLETPPV